jgi:hypothetical protein
MVFILSMYQGGWVSVLLEAGPQLSLNLNDVHCYQMYQEGCGEASAWKSVPLEAGTELSLKLKWFSFLSNVSGRLSGGLSMGNFCCGAGTKLLLT